MLETIRRYIAVISVALTAGFFWGMAVGIVVRRLTNLSEEDTLLFVVLPVAVFIMAVLWRRLPKILGFD